MVIYSKDLGTLYFSRKVVYRVSFEVGWVADGIRFYATNSIDHKNMQINNIVNICKKYGVQIYPSLYYSFLIPINQDYDLLCAVMLEIEKDKKHYKIEYSISDILSDYIMKLLRA